jgi:hypothetical protein
MGLYDQVPEYQKRAVCHSGIEYHLGSARAIVRLLELLVSSVLGDSESAKWCSMAANVVATYHVFGSHDGIILHFGDALGLLLDIRLKRSL